MQNIIIESIDRCGKDTLVNGLLNRLGYRIVIHRTAPPLLDFYVEKGVQTGKDPKFLFQYDCFLADMNMLKHSEQDSFGFIFNRSWLGESVYANLYRNYDGGYVFDLEKTVGVNELKKTRLVLLTEDFSISNHFQDDNLSLGPLSNREKEQNLFINAFDKSNIADKRIICVTDPTTGKFKSKDSVLSEVLS